MRVLLHSFLISICMKHFSHPFTFSLCISLALKWVSGNQHCFLSNHLTHIFWLEHLVYWHLKWLLIGVCLLPLVFWLFLQFFSVPFSFFSFFLCGDSLFLFCPQSFWASGTFPMSHLFASDDQNTGASGSASVLLVNIQGWSPLRSTGLVSLLLGTLRSCLQHHSQKASILGHSAFFTVPLSQPYMATGKTIALTIQTFVSRAMSLLFNTLSRFVIAFLPRSNRLLISWLQSPSAVILVPKKRKSVTTSPLP